MTLPAAPIGPQTVVLRLMLLHLHIRGTEREAAEASVRAGRYFASVATKALGEPVTEMDATPEQLQTMASWLAAAIRDRSGGDVVSDYPAGWEEALAVAEGTWRGPERKAVRIARVTPWGSEDDTLEKPVDNCAVGATLNVADAIPN